MDNTERYDRQLRMWGKEGQLKLERAHVCLVGCSADGVETLKNLVLPGVGQFTIVDPGVVTDVDLGANFFFEQASLKQPRARESVRLLAELNPAVRGHAVVHEPSRLVAESWFVSAADASDAMDTDDNDKAPSSKTPFSHVVVADNGAGLSPAELGQLAAQLAKARIPMFCLGSYGFVGFVHITAPEHIVLDSKPDNPRDDLRICKPFPALLAASRQAYDGLATMSSAERAHVPWIYLLVGHLDQWRLNHGGACPKTRDEKAQFKRSLGALRGKPGDANFDEAVAAAHHAFSPASVPEKVLHWLQEASKRDWTLEPADTAPFWLGARALADFVFRNNQQPADHHQLPLTGAVPDMTATTEGYLTLQHQFKTQAIADANAVASTLLRLLDQASKQAPKGSLAIAAAADIYRSSTDAPTVIQDLCKRAAYMEVVDFPAYWNGEGEQTASTSLVASRAAAVDDGTSFEVDCYVAWRASQRFAALHGRWPGSNDADVQADETELTKQTRQLLIEAGCPADQSSLNQDTVRCFVRAAGSTLHPVASVVGGVASQEIIKLITGLFVPMRNCFVFNGFKGSSATFAV